MLRLCRYCWSAAGLPDGLFSKQKSKFGKILEGLAMEDVGIFYGHLVHFTVFCYILLTSGIVFGNLVYFSVLVFYGHLVHFTVFCYILLTSGIVCDNLVYFFPFWYFATRKIWQPWSAVSRTIAVCLP
jgi:hypothetical protein